MSRPAQDRPHLRGTPCAEQPPAVHDRHTAGQREGVLQPVLRQHDRRPQLPVDFPQRRQKVCRCNGIKLTGRFVQNEHTGLHRHDRRQIQELLLPAGQLRDVLVDGGVETVEGPLPIVLTVNGSAAPCRPRNAKLLQKYKRALGAQEMAAITKDGAVLPYAELYAKYPYLNITEWSVADVEGDTKQCGLSGSPTKVKKIENIVFQAKESKTMTGSDQDVEDLIVELLANHTIG